MHVECNAQRVLSARMPTAALLLAAFMLQRFSVCVAIAVDTADGGSSKLQFEQPAQPLQDHTQTYFLPNRTGIVQLFEWKFADIATECEQFLGPHGYAGVQVSPVAEHLVVRSESLQQPWWERYQSVSLQIVSRSGGEAEFQQMTQACNAAGVRVYVDVVLNHMAGAYNEATASGQQLLEGFAGSTANASSYEFTALSFSSRHFHKPCTLTNYLDAHVVRNCELNGWPDLNHYRLDVRANLTDFLNRLVDLGVAGFRVDSAKYIWPIDIKLLFQGVKNLNNEAFDFPENARPFVYQDVVDLGVDSVSKTEYSSYGMVTDYLYAAVLANIINGKAPLSTLINWGPAMGFLPHQQALVFVDSHDGQRDHNLLGANQLISYKQPRKYIIVTAFMLAHPYGRVKRIMSSYYFAAQHPEQGPPFEEDKQTEADAEADASEVAEENVEPAEGDEEAVEVAENEAEGENEETEVENEAEEVDDSVVAEGDETAENAVASSSHIRSPTFDAATGRCEYASGWVCEHRWPPIVQMIQLVNTLSELEDGVINFQTDGPNHIAFCRGNKAFFVFNSDLQLAYDADVETCLPGGTYCDVISGGRAENGASRTDCAGKRVTVDAEGKTHIMLPAVLGVDEEDAAVGSDYDETDVEANDAYGIAAGMDGEFGVLAIYEGSRIDKEAQTDAGQTSLGADEDETVTEAVAEDDKEDAADAESVTETVDVTKEVMSAEELEDEVAETKKNAKLEEAATDASIGNENAEDETPAEDATTVDEVAEEQVSEQGEDEQPTVDGEEPTVDDNQEEIHEAVTELTKEIEVAVADEPAATEASNSENTSDEVVVDPPTSEEASKDDETVREDETATTAVNADQFAPNVTGLRVGLVNIEKVVKDFENTAGDDNGSGIVTGVKEMTDSVVEKTKEVIAKAGFNNMGARSTQSNQFCSLLILISAILLNL
ncbi:alpha-amylase-related protein [Bactrocera oleae]|uniref:alpha-amylase-related protein n=1 Tax=Bactrocera oleae TaxID=104688 RepID=UPI00387E6AD6